MATYSDHEASETGPQPAIPVLRDRVESVIQQGLSDMWLLLDGEEIIEDELANLSWRDGRAFAMVSPDQVHLLGSRFCALSALRSVGITL